MAKKRRTTIRARGVRMKASKKGNKTASRGIRSRGNSTRVSATGVTTWKPHDAGGIGGW